MVPKAGMACAICKLHKVKCNLALGRKYGAKHLEDNHEGGVTKQQKRKQGLLRPA